LLFHTLAELFSIVIKITIFAILYNSREHIDNSFFLIVGLSFIFIGFIDLIHTLAYTGMNIFIGYDTNLPAQLWISARYLQSISFLTASLVLNKKINEKYYLIGFTLFTVLIIISIFLRIFPDCFIEGFGLTPFKIISEYIIDIILIITLLIVFKNRFTFNKNIFLLLIFSIMVTITSELAFTFYTSAFGFFNLIGHILKIVAFFLLYKAIISIGLRNPIDLLYRQLKLSEIKYRNLVENIPNVIYSTSPDKTRTTTFISERWKEWTGVSPEDHYSYDNAWSKTIHPDDQDGVKNKFDEAISLKKEYDFEYSVIHKDTGEVFYLRDQGVPIKDDVNDINRYDGIISNITLRKKFEYALKKSENELKGRIKEITCLYRISDLALNFDKTESDLVNEILEIIPSAFRFPEITCARIIFDGNEFTSKNFALTDCNIKTDIRVYDKKLGTIEIYYIIPDVNKNLFVKEEKDLIRAIAGIISRFSEHKKAEEKLEQFVSNVSHELRNPIAVLLISLNYLEKYSENITREQESNLMKGIMRNVNLLNELVNDLLTLSRLDEKKMILDWIEYFPIKVISDVLDLMEPNLKSKNISVSLDINKDLSLYGDISRINQIFRIFIENAWKYSNNESTIVIKAIDHYSGIFNSEGIDGVLFQIIDSGMGIHEKDIPYIFDRFYRSNSVKDIPGTGLGLTIAKELIQLHHGKVFVTSEYGSGATFSIFFPRILN